jgi:glycosyltransferase involved in cell wall biosynthesis
MSAGPAWVDTAKSNGRRAIRSARYASAVAANNVLSPVLTTDVCAVEHYAGSPGGVARVSALLWKLIETLPDVRVRRLDSRAALPGTLGKPGSTIWFANARDLPRARQRLGWLYEHSRNIGYWAWELDHMPAGEAANAAGLSKIWTLSEFNAESIRRSTDVPCVVVPPPVLLDAHLTPAARDYATINHFVVVFDAYSSVERKNPWATVESFKQVLGGDPRKSLTIRVIRAQGLTPELRARLEALQDDQVTVMMETFPTAQAAQAFMAQHDAYLSLHRTEGLGFNIVEAIVLGMPVIATRYGGNLDFCDAQGVDLVDYDLVPVVDPQGLYSGDFVWAEPHIDGACAALEAMMQRRPAEIAEHAEIARQRVLAHFDTARIRGIVRERLGL